MNWLLGLTTVVLLAGYSHVLCLECFVGEGDSSVVLPATEEEIAAHKENKNDATFKIMECGSIDSELKRFDQIKKDVSDKIQAGFSAVAQKATDTFTRRRRESGEDKYACAKVLHDGKAYRSCTPKLGTIRLNCTSSIGQLAVCYCHEDYCNHADMQAGSTATSVLLTAALVLEFGME